MKMGVALDGCVDCVSCGGGVDRGYVAAGVSNFTGRWWTGQVSVLKPSKIGGGVDDDREGGNWGRGSARLRCGVSGVDWLEKDAQGACLASGGDDGSLNLWDVTEDPSTPGQIQVQYQDHNISHGNVVTSVATHPTLPKLATSSFDHSVIIWTTQASLQPERSLDGHGSCVWRVRWSPWNGSDLVTTSDVGVVKFWSVKQAKATGSVAFGVPVFDVAWCDEVTLAAGDESGCVSLFDVRKPGANLVKLEVHSDCVRTLAYNKDIDMLASCGDDGRVIVINHPQKITQKTTLQKNVKVLNPHNGLVYVRGLSWSMDGALFSGGWDSTVVKSDTSNLFE